MKSPNEQSKFLAFFLGPKRTKLKQKFEILKQMNGLQVIIDAGNNNDVSKYIEKYEVIITTPQKLLNSLVSNAISNKNIDVIIFDQCHDAVGDNPYCQIMKLLSNKDEKQPVIIGLT
ncbi:unnamed protein product, partial [Didymodactylos carnosus]